MIGAIMMQGRKPMPRQSITIHKPNDDWLKAQVSRDEYASKSEGINDLIRQARRRDEEKVRIVSALIDGEQSGLSSRSPDDIMKAVLKRRGLNADIKAYSSC